MRREQDVSSADDVVYLDYAATSAIRPASVVEAVAAYLRDVGATPGRAGHRRALDAGRVAFRCRRALPRRQPARSCGCSAG